MLKESEQQHAFHHEDRRQTDRARKEAQALFRPKIKAAEPTLTKPPADAPARKPRILSASPPPLGREIVKSATSSEPQIAAQVSRRDDVIRECLNRARAAVLQQQHELRVRLGAIECKMRIIDAYEAVKNGKTTRDPYGRRSG